ncbi:MAG TPA: RodZ domain-containing protein [Terriglobales bacterium]|nr:RodZ domain-containing protein [Terriglobales bacterium]
MESFGARLKRERERRGISLDDISVSTKIGTRMLRALEEDHFDQLPGGIFNRGFVRAYAHHLGLDEEQTIVDYLAASGDAVPGRIPESEEEAPVIEVRAEADSARAGSVPWGVFAIVVLLVAIGIAIWGSYAREKRKQAEQVAAPQSSQPAPPAPVASSARPVSARPVVPSTSTTPKPPAQTPSPAPGSFVVRINAREDCWVSVTADGKEILKDTLSAAADKSVEARREIVIRAGNVGALDFFFNGKRLPAQGDYGEVKTLAFDTRGLQPPPVKPLDTQPAPEQPQ